MKLGLALAGGGLKGIAHIGAIQALQDLGIKIDFLSGTSFGSMIATLYSVGYGCSEIQKMIVNSYKDIIKIEKRPILSSIGSYLTKKRIGINGLIPGERIEDLIQSIVERKKCINISDVKIPLAIVTVDTISTKECIFMSKDYKLKNEKLEYICDDVPIGKVVRSSMAFPGIFTTCSFRNYNFIDGGAKDNLPVKILRDMGADVTIGIGFQMDEYDSKNQNIFNVLLRTADIFSQKNFTEAKKIADVTIEMNVSNAGLMYVDNIESCIDIGYKAVINRKDEILKLLN